MLRALLSRFRPAHTPVSTRAKAGAHAAQRSAAHTEGQSSSRAHQHAAPAHGAAGWCGVLVPSTTQPRNPPVQRQAEVETDNVYTSEQLMSDALGEPRELHWGGELAMSGLSAYPAEAGPDMDHHLHAGGYQYHVVSQAAAPNGRPVTVHALWEERARAPTVGTEAQQLRY